MIPKPSPLLLAALTLQSAKDYLYTRCDGSWWVVDGLFWDVAHELELDEYTWLLTYVKISTQRRALRCAALGV